MKTFRFVALGLACACAAFLFSLSPAAAQTDVWSGTNTNSWDTAGAYPSSYNWNSGSGYYSDGDAVIFNDGARNTNIAIQSNGVGPASVNFATASGAAYSYSFSGGPISNNGLTGIPTTVTLAGTGSVTFSSSNTYSGGTYIGSGSTLTAGNPGSLGTGPVYLKGGNLSVLGGVPGVVETYIDATGYQPFGTNATNGYSAIYLAPRAGYIYGNDGNPGLNYCQPGTTPTASTPWSDNRTIIYDGFFNWQPTASNTTDTLKMAWSIDDQADVYINNNGTWVDLNGGPAWNNIVTLKNLSPGYHQIEIRFYNGVGGFGPSQNNAIQNGATNWGNSTVGGLGLYSFGIGYDPTGTLSSYTWGTTVGTDFLPMIDPGNGSMLLNGSVGANYANDLYVSAGSSTLSVSMTNSFNNLNLAGSLHVSGSNGYLSFSGGTISSSPTMNIDGGLVVAIPFLTDNGTTAGVFTKAGNGSLVLTGANSFVSGTSFKVSGGTLVAANGRNGSATGSGLVTVNAGVLASDPKLSGTIGGNVVANSGGQIAPGGIGAVGALAILGNLSLNNGSTLDFDLSGGSADKLTIDGGLSVSGTANVLLSALSPSSSAAPYILATFASGSVNTSEFNVTGVPNGYTFKATSTDLELDYGSPNNSVLGVSASLVSFGRVMLNHVPTTNVTVSLTGGTSQTGFSVSASSGITATASGNGPGAIPPSGSVSIGLTSATGSYSGTIQVQNSGDAGTGNGPSSAGAGQGNGQSPISISVSGTVVDNRVVTATPANFGLVHVGAALSQGITLSTTGDDNHYTRVTVPNPSAPDANGMSITGGANPTFNGPAISDTRAVSGVVTTAGILNGTIIVATSGEGLTGEKPVSVPVSYSAQVFSGSGNWAGTSSSWSANGNWTDANGSGIQAAPGSFAGFSNTDTAVFSGSGSVTAIDLTGANPSLNSLSFSNSSYMLSNGSLTLNGGSGTASVTVTSGTQTINTPLTLASNTNFTINGGTFLLNSTISGSGGFAKSGSGGLTLPEGNTLSSTGSISIVQGTLTSPFGISTGGGGITFAAGTTLQGGETLKRAITGIGTVTATDDLTIGSSKEAGQFNQGGPSGVGGTLNVGGNAVILLSSDTAILGSQTNIGPGGSLTALNGTQLGNPSSVDSTKVLTAAGNATINANFVNNGVVNGPTGTGQELTFTQAVQGAGATTGNVEYAASYKVGNSPDAVSVQNVLFDPTSTLVMEFAGDVPGSGYDQLDISGMATLNGTLDVEFLAGYTPSIGDSYDILSGKTTGSFVNLDLASLPPGMNWDTSALYSQGVITVTPEPSSLALLAAFALGLAGYGLRRRAARTARPAAFDQQADAPPILAFPSQLSTASPARRAA